jgi:hypothetical protein
LDGKSREKVKIYIHFGVYAWIDENVVIFTTIGVVTFGTTNYFCHLYSNE